MTSMNDDVARLKDELLDSLRSVGATSASVSFSGSGDQGDIDDVTIEGAESSQKLRDQLIALTDACIDRECPGYENDEGGGGTLMVDVTAGNATFESFCYVETIEQHPAIAL